MTDFRPPIGLGFTSAWRLRLARWRDRCREFGLGGILILQAATIFVVSPLAGSGRSSAELIEALRFGLAAMAILVVTRNRTISLFVGMTFVLSTVCTVYLRTGTAGQTVYLANILFTIAFDFAVAWTVAHATFDEGRVTVDRILGAVILYLYVGLIFASVYRLSAALLHPSFSGLGATRRANLGDLVYFSLSTLTTSGTAGIAPIHPLIRSLANLESVIGQLYPATLLARLVTLHGAERRSGDQRDATRSLGEPAQDAVPSAKLLVTRPQ